MPRLTCLELTGFLDEYLGGQLPAEAHALFYQHLCACPGCVAYVNSYRATIRLGQEALRSGDELPEEVPEELVAAIVAARAHAREPSA